MKKLLTILMITLSFNAIGQVSISERDADNYYKQVNQEFFMQLLGHLEKGKISIYDSSYNIINNYETGIELTWWWAEMNYIQLGEKAWSIRDVYTTEQKFTYAGNFICITLNKQDRYNYWLREEPDKTIVCFNYKDLLKVFSLTYLARVTHSRDFGSVFYKFKYGDEGHKELSNFYYDKELKNKIPADNKLYFHWSLTDTLFYEKVNGKRVYGFTSRHYSPNTIGEIKTVWIDSLQFEKIVGLETILYFEDMLELYHQNKKAGYNYAFVPPANKVPGSFNNITRHKRFTYLESYNGDGSHLNEMFKQFELYLDKDANNTIEFFNDSLLFNSIGQVNKAGYNCLIGEEEVVMIKDPLYRDDPYAFIDTTFCYPLRLEYISFCEINNEVYSVGISSNGNSSAWMKFDDFLVLFDGRFISWFKDFYRANP